MNIICGGNAQGKTTLLEAIYLLSTGRSFRTTNLSEIIHHGEEYFYLKATIEKDGAIEEIKLRFDKQEKRLWINNNRYFSFSHLLGLLPSVLSAPQDQLLISGSPQDRRRFFNLHLAQHDPLYVHHLTRYFKSLKQRTYLLRHPKSGPFEIWEEQMAISGSYISTKRKMMLDEMEKDLQSFMQKLSNKKEKLEIRYIPSFPFHSQDVAAFKDLLAKSREREKKFGFTAVGPHRDDFLCLINDKSAKTFASEGQKRTCIAALKLAEWKRLCHFINDTALIQIDDLSLHLDSNRKSLMRNSLQSLGQVFFTTPDPKDQWSTAENAFLFEVEKGSIISPANV